MKLSCGGRSIIYTFSEMYVLQFNTCTYVRTYVWSCVSLYTDPSRDAADRLGGMLGRLTVSQAKEPNLNDVIDFLSSDDPGLVANAASYLQHLAYGDDSMKAKIRYVKPTDHVRGSFVASKELLATCGFL